MKMNRETARKIAGFGIVLFFVLMLGNIGAAEQTTGADFWKAIVFAVINLTSMCGSFIAFERLDT